MFSLGLVVAAIFNRGRALIQANHSNPNYTKQMEMVNFYVNVSSESFDCTCFTVSWVISLTCRSAGKRRVNHFSISVVCCQHFYDWFILFAVYIIDCTTSFTKPFPLRCRKWCLLTIDREMRSAQGNYLGHSFTKTLSYIRDEQLQFNVIFVHLDEWNFYWYPGRRMTSWVFHKWMIAFELLDSAERPSEECSTITARRTARSSRSSIESWCPEATQRPTPLFHQIF